ncbi:F0F1 ATP synthase subunit B family protein [Rickettsia endosymbiont of Cardiosporidium cionae]|uniref:F0F1 ATP synthase subunit B family protein n=1 Tax=Rickettsia endosymbiont of Cardiosporidium cionae TaxID=2777155 RepID=UPI001893FA7F|nr:hypothetical protein [Rickettsia endosymbiont of Cardiosporidium cionae]KAF8818583.1 ATP synthase subunit b [Rickettsia endosymbiont of Cardiosporidium cionae]
MITDLFDKLNNENLWIAVAFIILVLYLYISVRKVIIQRLDQKILSIKQQFSEAELVKNNAKLLYEDINTEIQRFASRKKGIIDNAQYSADQFVTNKNIRLNSTIENKRKSAEQSMILNKNLKIENICNELNQKVLSATKCYIKEHLDITTINTKILENIRNNNQSL